MPWFKVDDGLCFHPKAIAAGNSALGLWVRAGSWCGANLTGGALPRHMIGTFGAQKRDAQRLISAGLWCETEEGYQFKDWDVYQPTKEQVEADRKAGRERQARWRERHANASSNAVTNDTTNGVTNAAPSRPVLKQEDDALFDEFWSAYPRKTDKGNAKKAWLKAIKKKPAAEIISAAAAYAATKPEPKYTAHPTTWLNGERWDDELSRAPTEQQRWYPPEVPPDIDPDDTEAYAAAMRKAAG
jgi:hypothetical protein